MSWGTCSRCIRDFEKEVVGARSVETARKLNPALMSFAQWLEAYKGKIPLE